MRIHFIWNNIKADTEAFQEWFKRKTELPLEVTSQNTALSNKYKFLFHNWNRDFYGPDGLTEVLPPLLTSKADVYIYVYDADTQQGLANYTYSDDLNGGVFISMPFTSGILFSFTTVITHEICHGLNRLLRWRGIYVLDDMDTNSTGDDDIESPTGNRARNLARMKPYFKNLMNYRFNKDLEKGMTDPDVKELQKRLNEDSQTQVAAQGAGSKGQETNYFGDATRVAVMKYQLLNGLTGIGRVGPLTRAKLNQSLAPLTLVEAMIQVESEGNDYAEGDKSLKDHAYGCLQVRQGVVDAVNSKLGTHYKSQDCLGNRELSLLIFNTYWTIYPENDTDEEKARAWNGGPGWRKVKKTNPSYTDGYWAKVSSFLGSR